MFTQYFTYWDDLPADSGFDLFGKIHLTWLLFIALAILAAAVLYTKSSAVAQNRFFRICACILLIMEVYKDSVLTAIGHMEFQYLPLHLCGMALFLEVLCIFFPCPFLSELTCVVCLPGAAAALLFPDWSRYPVINFMNLHSFLVHGILVMIPLLTMLSGKYIPQIRRIYMPLLFFAVAAPAIYRINLWQGTNFMFLNRPSLGSPFETVWQNYGYGAYLAAYIAVVFGVLLLMYGLTAMIAHSCRTPS